MLSAAANASSHASTSAITTVKAAPAAASPFAQLLRSSKFATYDPQIRQTYYSPQQFVERGYWGLKRPITQRKKNSFITVKQWETRQHYIEWDNAEDQVRFIRRVEELNVRPGLQANAKWAQQLGPAKSTWLVDSEFSPHAWDAPAEGQKGEETTEETQEAEEDVPEPPEQIPIGGLGKQGPGRYGGNATRDVTAVPSLAQDGKQQYRRPPAGVIPNIASMSPAAFERYLEKLRRIRPAFKDFLAREEERQKKLREERDLRAQQTTQAVAHSLEPQIAGKSLMEVAQIPDSSFHLFFIAEHTKSEYQSTATNRIQPQPHRNGALMYTHPSTLDSLFHNKPKPGIILDNATMSAGRFAQMNDLKYVVAFAGFAAHLDAHEAFVKGKIPLMDPGVKVDNWPKAIAEMRPVTWSAMALRNVPRVVGADPDEGLSGVKVDLTVTMARAFDDPRRKNPHVPGSRVYIAHEGLDAQREAAARTTAAAPPVAPLSSLKNAPKRLDLASPAYQYQAQSIEEVARTQNVIQNLVNILGTGAPNDKVGDDEM